jgi:hypothetical protein
MTIARVRNRRQDAWEPSRSPLRLAFFHEGAASFFRTAVDHMLGFDLVTACERTIVSVYHVGDAETRADLLESARRMGGHEVPLSRQ